MGNQTERKALLTTEIVARWLGVSTRTLRLWAECEEIPAFKLRKQWRFREEEIRAWLKKSSSSKKLPRNNSKNLSTNALF